MTFSGRLRRHNAICRSSRLSCAAHPWWHRPATTGHAQHPTHPFDAVLYPMVFDKDILHFRRFSKYVAPVGNGQLLKLMALKLGNSANCCSSRSDRYRPAAVFYAMHKVAIRTGWVHGHHRLCQYAQQFSKLTDGKVSIICGTYWWLWMILSLVTSDWEFTQSHVHYSRVGSYNLQKVMSVGWPWHRI